MSLTTTPLGTTGMELTRAGFGAWAIGGGDWSFAWGPQDDDASVAAIHHAVERGVNWIDTAAVYGLGHSEEVVGRALRELPAAERPYVFTKCGLVWDAADRTVRAAARDGAGERARGGRGLAAPPGRGSHRPLPGALARRGRHAARRVLADHGRPPRGGQGPRDRAVQPRRRPARPRPRRSATSTRCSRRSPRSTASAADGAGLVRRQRDRGDRLLADAVRAAHRSVLRRAGRGAALRRLAPDRPGLHDPARPEPRAGRCARPVAARHDVSVAAVAVAWTLAWPGVTGAIVGARSPRQVDGWVAAADLVLTDADLDEIAAAIASTGAGQGPVRPERG